MVFRGWFRYWMTYLAVLLPRGWIVTFSIFLRSTGFETSAMKVPKSFLSSPFPGFVNRWYTLTNMRMRMIQRRTVLWDCRKRASFLRKPLKECPPKAEGAQVALHYVITVESTRVKATWR